MESQFGKSDGSGQLSQADGFSGTVLRPVPLTMTAQGSSRQPRMRRPVPGNLPESELAKLRRVSLGVEPGDVFRVPSCHLNWSSTSAYRFCVVAALEQLRGDDNPSIAHLVVGSKRPDIDPTVPLVKVEAGEADLDLATYFAFDMSSAVSLTILRDRSECAYKGRLDRRRVDEMRDAIGRSAILGPRLGRLL